MAYTKQTWTNGAAGATPLSAARLGVIEDGVAAAHVTADAATPKTRLVTAGTGLTGGGDLSADRTLTVAYGTAAGTAAQGNDGRLSDQRTPADASVTPAKFAAAAIDPAAGTAGARTLGTGAQQAAPGNDGRFGPAGRRQQINAQTAAYTLVLADEEKLVTVTAAAVTAVTIPTNATVAFPVGARVEIMQTGAGQATVAGAAGVTLRLPPTRTAGTRGQYSRIDAQKIAADEWVLGGDLA